MPVGTDPHGDVYKTEDQILTVEASNVYEAFIVISAGDLVGFYLPVEDAFLYIDRTPFVPNPAISTFHLSSAKGSDPFNLVNTRGLVGIKLPLAHLVWQLPTHPKYGTGDGANLSK